MYLLHCCHSLAYKNWTALDRKVEHVPPRHGKNKLSHAHPRTNQARKKRDITDNQYGILETYAVQN